MKRNLMIFGCSLFLLAGNGWAEDTKKAEQDMAREIYARAGEMRKQAETQALADCANKGFTLTVPDYDSRTKSEKSIEVVYTIEWSGGCKAGKRDGEGVLSWSSNDKYMVAKFKSEGRMVNGRRLGLWCATYSYQSGQFEKQDNFCSVLAGHQNPLTERFRKQPNGSWLEFIGDTPAGLSLAPNTLESFSQRVLSAAIAGKEEPKSGYIGKHPMLDGLLPKSEIVLLPPDYEPLDLAGKRIAFVLSGGTIKDLERFKRERQALIDATKDFKGDGAKYRAEFITASDPDWMLLKMRNALQGNAQSIEPADDLTGLASGQFDYAFILDWRDQTRFDLLGKYGSFPDKSKVSCQTASGFIIDAHLKAVKYSSGIGSNCRRPYILPTNLGGGKEDENVTYMCDLATSFSLNYGKAITDQGIWLKIFLEMILR